VSKSTGQETLVIVGDPVVRASAFVEFCSGLEEAGLDELARRGRTVARDVLKLAPMLEAERSASRATQARADQLQEIVGTSTYYALIAEARNIAQATMLAKDELTARRTGSRRAR
jgi:hypothetical protein